MEFPGEDRSYGGSRLYVDLIPETSWYRNAHHALAQSDWRAISHAVAARAEGRCECCNAPGRLEAHERWQFRAPIQRLVRLIALCPGCHEATHFGRAMMSGRADQAREVIMRVNGWDREQLEQHIREAFETWNMRSQVQEWRTDMSIIARAGFQIRPFAPTRR